MEAQNRRRPRGRDGKRCSLIEDIELMEDKDDKTYLQQGENEISE